MSNVIEILKTGRDRLLTRGWCQYSLIDATGGCCAIGAMMANPQRDRVSPEEEFLIGTLALEETLSIRGMNRNILAFNNAIDRTKEEVVELFNDTIARLEEMTLPGKSVTITVEPLKTTQPAKEPTGPPFEAPNAPVVVPDREPVPA